jgi:hypothetical protein
MSVNYETLLKNESGMGIVEFGGKKIKWNPPQGALILTDKSLIFAALEHPNLQTLPAVFAPYPLMQKAVAHLTKVNPEDINEALKNKGSFLLPLNSIVSVGLQKVGLWGKALSIRYNTPDGEYVAALARAGMNIYSFEQWVEAINQARKGFQ